MSYQSMDKIVDHLYITNWETSNNVLELKRNNIKAIFADGPVTRKSTHVSTYH